MKKVLILSVGGTSDPLVKSIDEVQPDQVIFIASKETASEIQSNIIELTQGQGLQYQHEVITLENAEDLHEAFEAGYKAKAHLNGGEDIYVDYTGGTKSMSVGLALAFFGKDIKEYLYVGGNERQKEGVGTVKPGHERLVQKVDPANLYAFNIAKKVEQFFNNGQYHLAYHILESEVPKHADDQQKVSKELVFLKKLTHALYLWDSMNYHRSFAEISTYQKETKDFDFSLFQVNISEDFKEHLKKCSEGNEHHRIGDLIHAIKKRKEHGEYDEAVLRIYRTIEYIGQVKFKKVFDCETSDVQIEKLKDLDIYDKLKRKSKGSYSVKLLVSEVYDILNEKGVIEGQSYKEHEQEFKKFNNMRHQSVLAHGFQPCQESDVDQGLQLIQKLRKNKFKLTYPQIKFQK